MSNFLLIYKDILLNISKRYEGLAIKLKNIDKRLMKVFFIISIIILFCLGMVWLMDQGFNGAIKEWLYNMFYIEPNVTISVESNLANTALKVKLPMF